MAPQRKIDVVLDSVRRLLRMGATANLQNLLQKQHPADLGQVFGGLHDGERAAVFSILVERQPKLAMESVSELGPERGAALLDSRSAEDIARLAQEIPSDDAAALIALRLAYVLDYCDRNEPLPLVMDDVLVNFDEDRAATTLQALRDVARTTQVLFLTCHRHLMHLARQTADTGAALQVIELPGPPAASLPRPAEA